MVGRHTTLLVLGDHLLGESILREAVERHRHARCLKLGGHLDAKVNEEIDGLAMGHEGAAS
jgi:hypothetical protein